MDLKKIEKGVRMILEGIGEDTERSGIKETPERVARMYEEIFSGLETPTEELLKAIEGETHDEMVLLKDIPFYSVCEHHMIPFIGKVHVAYIPSGGKIARPVPQPPQHLRADISEYPGSERYQTHHAAHIAGWHKLGCKREALLCGRQPNRQHNRGGKPEERQISGVHA